MSNLCGPSTLATDRQREDKKSNWAESLHLVLGDRSLSERGQTFAEIVVSELKKLSEAQAMLARDIEAQHKEVIKRLDQQYGPLASEAEGTWRPAVQPLATDHKEPPGLSMNLAEQSTDLDTRDDREELEAIDYNAKILPDTIVIPKRSPTIYTPSVSNPLWDRVDASQRSMRITHEPGPVEIFITGYGELFMGVVIVLNMIVLCAELQIMGETQLAYHIGIVDTQGNWENQEVRFANVELVFTSVYMVDLLIKLKILGLAYMEDAFNIVDSMVVLVAAVQSFVLRPLTRFGVESGFSIIFARILKLARIIRVVKVLRFMKAFVELRILLKTIWSSKSILLWDVLLVTVNVVCSGILIFQMSSLWIQDESVPDDTRVWLYDNFGTWARAAYSMFEATFSSAWTSKASYMLTEISGVYAAFWMIHVVLVNFALMRIVAALFLKQTMQVAAVDAEQTALRELKTKEEYAGILSAIFKKADTSQDGAINAEEFAVMMVDPDISNMFQKMELTLDEVKMLFSVLVEEDGLADYDEFLSAALKMKNSAKGIDAVQILHQIAQVKKLVVNVASQGQAVSDGLDRMAARLSAMDHTVSQLQVRGKGRSCRSLAADPVSALATRKMEPASTVRAV